MSYISKSAYKLIAQQKDSLIRSFGWKKAFIGNSEELRYLPQLTPNDVVEFHNNDKTMKILFDNISKLKELRERGMTQAAIADHFGVKRSSVQAFLYKYLPGVTKESTELNIAIKQYCLSTVKEEKEKAFGIIDKYLEKVAKEEVKTRKNISYEDCLQDVRLRFFEIISNKQKTGSFVPQEIIRSLNESAKVTKPIIPVSRTLTGIEAGETDSFIEMFENKDITDYLIENSGLLPAEKEIVTMVFKDGKSLSETGFARSITTARTKNFLASALTKIKNLYETINTNQYIKDRADFSCKVAVESAFNDVEKSLYKISNSNHYYI